MGCCEKVSKAIINTCDNAPSSGLELTAYLFDRLTTTFILNQSTPNLITGIVLGTGKSAYKVIAVKRETNAGFDLITADFVPDLFTHMISVQPYDRKSSTIKALDEMDDFVAVVEIKAAKTEGKFIAFGLGSGLHPNSASGRYNDNYGIPTYEFGTREGEGELYSRFIFWDTDYSTTKYTLEQLSAEVILFSAEVLDTSPDVAVLSFSAPLANVVPNVSAIALTKNSQAYTNFTLSIVGGNLHITMVDDVVFGDVLSVAYTKPVTSFLQDAGGNGVDSFTSAITNSLNSGPSYWNPQTNALLERMETQPEKARITVINDTIKALIRDGLWDKLSALWVFAAHDSQSSLLNWKADLYNCNPIGSPIFTIDSGWQGNGESSYLDTQFNPSTDGGGIYTLNNASIGIYSLTDIAEAMCDIGCRTSTYNYTGILSRITEDVSSSRIHNGLGSVVGGAVTNSTGMFTAVRSAVATLNGYRNKSELTVTGNPADSTSIPNCNMFIGARNYNGTPELFSTRKYAFAFIGGALTSDEVGRIYDIMVGDWI